MNKKISLLTATKNNQKTIEKTLKSAKDVVSEIIIIDNGSTDKTLEIAKRYKAKIIFFKGDNLGRQYQKGLEKAENLWILILDSDEYLSSFLKKEIKDLIEKNQLDKYDGYLIPFQNYFLNKPINYGGENYQMLRLFKKNKIYITPEKIHQKYILKSKKIKVLKNKIIHHSYQSLCQTYKKFTYYAIEEAKQKIEKGEKSSFKKIFLYPLHMFYARFIKDKGYKDGFFRIPLDLGFAYMEFLTYFLLFINQIFNKNKKNEK
ncbi:MAG: glycosyltransferase family 2 protein [Patescibacteria group bacterium]|nr:glycosyltransferase family 2 protein [Patescibacteria group bacterium]